MKKRLYLYPLICLLTSLILWGIWDKKFIHADSEEESLWLSQRFLPEKIAVDAYLTGNFARSQQDLSKAVTSYLKVLEKDPQNASLVKDIYLLAMIQGYPQEITPYLPVLEEKAVFSDYFQVVNLFQKGDFAQARSLLKHKKAHRIDALLAPLVSVWFDVKENKKEAAVAELDKITKEPFLSGYQKVLLGVYFKDNSLIQKGIVQMGDHDILALGYFPLLKQVINQSGNWDHSSLNSKYQEMRRVYPATADVLIQAGQTQLTPETGLAEVFYLVSALGGRGLLSREEALVLNSLSLFLQPDKQIALIWGAELSEGLKLPKIALSYYERLQIHTATLAFKEASVLVLADRSEEALSKLEMLEKSNPTSIPLLTLLGQVYQIHNQKEKALDIYNRLIPLLEEKLSNPPLIQAYIARGNLYGPEKGAEMLSDLKRAHALDPENAVLLNDLGYHQLEMGQIEEGFQLVQKAYFKKPDDPYILDSMAFGYWKKGQSQVALPLAEKALDLMPQSALINAHLGDIYTQLGRYREAQFQYKKALDLKTDLSQLQVEEISQKLKGESK